MNRNGWEGDWPPRAKPPRPTDGIRAQSKRGAFAAGWWAKRWISVLEAFEFGSRLTRGRSYARGGQVTEISLELGGVRAKVQGSRPDPYDVTIRLRQLDANEWRSIGTAIENDVGLCAALLAGDMPENIETAFAAAGASLFPASLNEIKTACSCPDWSNPCKHVAAVFYLMGEEFDRDPLLLFVVRGLARTAVRDLFAATPLEEPAARRRTSLSSPVHASPALFWGDDIAETNTSIPCIVATSADEPPVLRRAGKFPFWRGDVTLADAITPIYNAAATFALDWLTDHADTSQK